MGSSRKSPAIFAGLIGIGVFGIPVPSYALEVPFKVDLPSNLQIPFTFEDFASSPAVYFVLGCLAGACVSGLIVYAVQKHGQKVLRERFTNELNEARAAERAAQEALESSASESQQSQATPAADTTDQQTKALNFTNPYSTGMFSRVDSSVVQLPTPVEIDASSTFVSARLDALLPHVSSGSFATVKVADSHEQEPKQDSTLAAPNESSSAALALSSPAEPTAPATTGGSSQLTHTSEITTTYAERQANRKRGVFSLLSERLGSNMMNDIPVIERADGTVADIGTSWWSDTMGNTMTQLSSHDDAKALGLRPADETTDLEAAAAMSANARRRERSRTLAENLPTLDAPLYPETTSPESAPGDTGADTSEDLFEEAMRNMDDELPNPGITTSSEAQPEAVVPPEALDNFQNIPPEDDMPTADLSQAAEASNVDVAPEQRRKSWHVVAGGVVDVPQQSQEEPTVTSQGSYRPKHMRRKQA